MDNKIKDGDWQIENSYAVTVDGMKELLQRVEMRLRTRRGEFYLDKNFGSLLYKLNNCGDEKELLALEYARQALEEMEQVFVTKCIIENGTVKVVLIIQDVEKEVIIKL